MRDKGFFKRLQAELPTWVENGWVTPEHRQAILDHVERTQRSSRYITILLSAMGALLLGAGVITFFSANWGLIPKAAKLAMLFGALGASYAAAGVCLARNLKAVGEALLLLGVILFGANIFLIAQIYHIDAHYPNGLLVWALAALVVAALARSQFALLAGVGLTILWSATETFYFGRNPHWPFFLPWLVALALTYRYGWLLGLRAVCWTLFAWCFFVLCEYEFLDRRWLDSERAALIQLYVFIGISIYIVARGMSWYRDWARFAPPLVTVGAVMAVVSLFLLSYPNAHRLTNTALDALPAGWIVATVVVLILVAALMVWRYIDTPLATLPWYRQGAFGWLGVSGALMIGNLLFLGQYPGWVAFAYNLLSLAGVVWLVMTGVERRERRLVNLGFAFFAAILLARYFDTFWTLLNRSYFFMGGGALLLVMGFFIERSRRRLTTRITAGGGQ